MNEARVVDLKKLGVDVDKFEKIYRMGEEDGRADVESELLESKDSDELSQKIAIDILERGIAKGREDGMREFAKWYFTKYFNSSQKDIDNILSEYEKEQRNENSNK